ncbi:MAG: TIGR01777 family oxidoreductase [Chthoniobacterales bacterium]
MVPNQTIVIGLTGASGLLGQEIIRRAVSQGDQVVAYSRTPDQPVSGAIRTEAFGPGMAVSNLDAILHLAGESILGRWTKARRDRILQSRIQGTRSVVEAFQNAPNPPRTLICASGVNIYGDRGEEELIEESSVGSAGFLCSVAVAWEEEAMRAARFGVRVVTIRIAMVLGRKGALALMLPAFWLGLGGRLGSGNQWMPWIHVEDVANLFLHAAREESLAGPLNGLSPFPVRNRDFTRILGSTLRRPAFLVMPSFILKAVLQDQASLLLDSERALPKRALETGFRFRFPYLEGALQNLLKERRIP